MKRSIFLSVMLFVSAFTINAQNDTLYIMKNGGIVGQYNVNTDVDSIIFYRPTLSNPNIGTYTDTRDNTVYNWVQIGDQVWMAENLKYLPSVVGPGTGNYPYTTPYYYVYGYNDTVVADAKATANYNTYGVLYNWAAAMNGAITSYTNPSGVQGVCPAGWHLPSDSEWSELIIYLGNRNVAGGKLKDTILWNSPNTGATNESGFSALPGGYRENANGTFYDFSDFGFWWSTAESYPYNSWLLILSKNNNNVESNCLNKGNGYSVRCVRD